jgi:hypothetical protein
LSPRRVLRLDDMPGTGPQCGGAEGVIAMRRVGVIVALGALLGMFGGMVTAAPALAVGGRGDGWVFQDFGPGFTTTNCGFLIQATQDVDNVFMKALTAPDGSMIFLATGAAKITFTNPANGKSVSENASAAAKVTVNPDGTATFVSMGPMPIDLTPADAARLGVPAVFVFAGRGTAMLDAAGNIISASMDGHILVNLCTALS